MRDWVCVCACKCWGIVFGERRKTGGKSGEGAEEEDQEGLRLIDPQPTVSQAKVTEKKKRIICKHWKRRVNLNVHCKEIGGFVLLFSLNSFSKRFSTSKKTLVKLELCFIYIPNTCNCRKLDCKHTSELTSHQLPWSLSVCFTLQADISHYRLTPPITHYSRHPLPSLLFIIILPSFPLHSHF